MLHKCDIFISYPKEEREKARIIASRLNLEGYNMFVDIDEMSADGNFEQHIAKALSETRAVIFIYGKGTEKSQWQRRECEYFIQKANSQGIPFVPIISCPVPDESWYKGRIDCFEQLFIDDKDDFTRLVSQLRLRLDSSLRLAPKNNGGVPEGAQLTCKTPPWHTIRKKVILKWCTNILLVTSAVFVVVLFMMLPREKSKPHKNEECEDTIDTISADSLIIEIVDSMVYDTLPCDSTDVEHNNHQYADSSQKSSTSGNEYEFVETDLQKNSEDSIVAKDDDAIVAPIDTDDIEPPVPQVYTLQTYFLMTILAVVSLACVGIFLFKRLVKSVKNIKITVNQTSNVYIDGKFVAKLNPYEVYSIHLNKGAYIFQFEGHDKKERESTAVSVASATDCMVVNHRFDHHQLFQENQSIKVFIAGSTKLVAERDALRSIISRMYNRFKKENLIIEAYSFDDFPRTFTEGGHQKLYDKFIREEADWVVFITDGTIGDKTIWELENAIKAHKQLGHPKILMYSKPLNTTEVSERLTSNFKQILNDEDNYWIDYCNIEDIRSSFQEHLQYDIIQLLRSNNDK